MAKAKKAVKAVDPKHKAAKGITVEDMPAISTLARSASVSEGGFDIGQLLALWAKYGPMIEAVIGSFKSKPAPAPVPTPEPGTPTPVPAPVPTPAAADRVITSFKSHWLGWEGYKLQKPKDPDSGVHFLLGGGTVSRIVAGTEFVGLGYRGHVDVTPLDQHGVPFFAPDVAKYADQFFQDPAAGEVEGNNRIDHYIIVNDVEYGPQGDMVPGTPWEGQPVAGLTSEYDQAALTPVILINYDLALGDEWTVSYRADYHTRDGKLIHIPAIKEVKVKPWALD